MVALKFILSSHVSKWMGHTIVTIFLPRCYCQTYSGYLGGALSFSRTVQLAHRARDTVAFLQRKEPDFISPTLWPPNSPNLNPVDYSKNIYLYISAHSLATKTTKDSISIILRSGNRNPVVAIACTCKFPRWRPLRPPKQIFIYISAHKSATKINLESVSSISRSDSRSVVLTIAWKY